MFRKDFLVRQFEEFGKFLALITGMKSSHQWQELEKLVNESSQKYTSVEIIEVEKINNSELINYLIVDNHLKEAQLKMLGDLFYEKGLAYLNLFKEEDAHHALLKAQIIFLYIKNNSLEIDFSLDMHFKMEAIEQLINKSF